MITFSNYIDATNPSIKLDSDDILRRSEWTSGEIADGIVIKAIEGITSLLCPDFIPPIHKNPDGCFSIVRSLTYRGCRFHVLGSNEIKTIQQSLINEAIDKSREAIVLCVLASVGIEMLDDRQTVSVDMRTGVIPLYPNDINALALNKATFEQLIEYKLLRRILNERPDSETQYVERIFNEYGCNSLTDNKCFISVPQAIEQRGESESSWVDHPYLQQIDDNIIRKRHNLLFGYSSSGKTILAFQVAQRRIAAGWHVQYVNLSNDISIPAGIVQKLLFRSDTFSKVSAVGSDHLVIVDDLQSNPALARLFLAISTLLHRVRDSERPIFLGVSWKEFAPDAAKLCPEAVPTAIYAELIRKRLIEKYSTSLGKKVVADIERDAGDDIYLLSLALEVTAKHNEYTGRETVAEDVWNHWLSSIDDTVASIDAQRTVLLVAAIGQFDIHVPTDFVQRIARVDYYTISKLAEARLLRKIGDRVTLGHRSLCALIAWWLGKNDAWMELKKVNGPDDVPKAVLSYLSTSGTAVMIDDIRAIVARTGFKSDKGLNHRAVVMMNVWRAFDAVIERVENQQIIDPTWGNTPSSSMFVTALFSEIGKIDKALQSIDFLRDHWRIVDDRIDIDTSGFSTVVDFDIIRQRMLDEDALSRPLPENSMDIDIERFHKTWLAGLILGAEAVIDSPRIPLDKLASYMEKEQITTTGAFYPHRVPWCTARVILGLAECGRSVTTSIAVQRAVEWLMKDRKNGGAASDGIWHSGTGTWNSDIETTALVILALVKAGVDPTLSPCIVSGREYLISMSSSWRGLEGAAAIEALLASGSKWEDLADDTESIAQRALEQSLWQSATLPADEIFQQTCHVAQVATHLVGIGWTAIRSDLTELLVALDLPDNISPTAPNAETGIKKLNSNDISKSGMEGNQFVGDKLISNLRILEDLKLDRFVIIGDYLRFEEKVRTELLVRCKSIIDGLKNKSKCRENYLIWAPPGSGKTFLVSEIARTLSNECNFVILNLSSLTQDQFIVEIEKLSNNVNSPTLCMIDEADSRETEKWPYEELFSCLDWNLRENKHIVFVLAGSSGKGLNGMMRAMKERPKGLDMLDRIPEANRFEIPNQVIEDRMIVFVKNAIISAAERSQKIKSIDSLALFYVLKNDALTTNRQISEVAKRAVNRMESSDDCLLYDHMFRNGDNSRMDFYSRNVKSAGQLQGRHIWIDS